MNRTLILLFILASYASSCISNTENNLEKKSAIVIESVNIINVDKGTVSSKSVVIYNNKIVQIVDNKDISVPESALIINGHGKYLIPGLWDMHVHLTFTEKLENTILPLFVASGVTSVRDVGGQIDKVLSLRHKSETTKAVAPRIFLGGPLLDGAPRVYDGYDQSHSDISVALNTIEDAKLQVDLLAEQGVDFIKTYEMLPADIYRAVINRAKYHGLLVTGHVPLSMTVSEASDAGLNSMEHLHGLIFSCSSESDLLLNLRRKLLREGRDETSSGAGARLRGKIHSLQNWRALKTFDKEKCSNIIERLAANGTWQIPTLNMFESIYNPGFVTDMLEQDAFLLLPDSVQTEWRKRAKLHLGLNSSELRGHFQWIFDRVREMNQRGVKIMAGTDAPLPLVMPGFSLHQELEVLVKAGLTPFEALRAATLIPAQYFKLDDKLGKIEEQMWADLVLLSKNPLEDIRNTRSIEAVIKDGIFYNVPEIYNIGPLCLSICAQALTAYPPI